MTDDHFDSEVQRFVSEHNGGDLVPKVLWKFIEALDKDLGSADSAGKLRHKETMTTLSEHIKEDKKRLNDLAMKLGDMRSTCEARGLMCPGMHQNIADPMDATQIRGLAAERARGVVATAQGVAVEVVHTAEERARILADASEEGDIKRAWRVAKWFVLGAGVVLINQLGNMWFGK